MFVLLMASAYAQQYPKPADVAPFRVTAACGGLLALLLLLSFMSYTCIFSANAGKQRAKVVDFRKKVSRRLSSMGLKSFSIEEQQDESSSSSRPNSTGRGKRTSFRLPTIGRAKPRVSQLVDLPSQAVVVPQSVISEKREEKADTGRGLMVSPEPRESIDLTELQKVANRRKDSMLNAEFDAEAQELPSPNKKRAEEIDF